MTILGLLINSFDYYNIVKFDIKPEKWLWFNAIATLVIVIYGSMNNYGSYLCCC